MNPIPTAIIGHESNGKCSLTGKENVECFIVRVGDGETKHVGVARLIEVLRWNCSISLATEPAKQNREARRAD